MNILRQLIVTPGRLKISGSISKQLNFNLLKISRSLYCLSQGTHLFRDLAIVHQVSFCTNIQKEFNKTIDEWKYHLDPFGKLHLNVMDCQCKIYPIDPNEYPDQEIVEVLLQVKGSTTATSSNSNYDEHCVKCERIGDDIHINQVKKTNTYVLDVKVPIKFDLSLNLKGLSNVDISALENKEVNVNIEQGTCRLSNIKSQHIKISTKGGDIVSEKTLQGNATFQTVKHGSVDIHRPVCEDLCVETEYGNVSVKSLYANKSYFNTRRGSINIGSCHKDAMVNIQQSGNLTIGTLDGSLLACVTHGNVDTHITSHQQMQVLVTKGDIKLKLAETAIPTQTELRADCVNIADNIDSSQLNKIQQADQDFLTGCLGNNTPPTDQQKHRSLVATTGQGHINVSRQSWLDSLKLNSATDEQ